MVVSPPPIDNFAPAVGTLVRRPRIQILVAGNPLVEPAYPYVLELSMTRGLDQELASADITYPYPLPDYVRHWSRVQILIGVDDPDSPAPYSGMLIRFTGYVISFQDSLWPGQCVIHCEDILAIAKYTFTPEEVGLVNETDRSAVIKILTDICGYSPAILDFGPGTGKILGDVDEANLFWEEGQTALEAIKTIDSASLGWRTYGTAGGRIARTFINTTPWTESVVHWFGEGVDMLDGSASTEIIDAKTEITVTGFDGSATASIDDDPFDWRKNRYWIRFMMLKKEATTGNATITALEVAQYILSQLNKDLVKVTFSTHLPILFQGSEVIGVTSKRLKLKNKFWVQSVQLTVQPDGAFTQTITGVSELAPYNRGVVNPPVLPPVEAMPGVPLPPPIEPIPVPPGPDDILAMFSIDAIDQEFGAPADEPDNTGETYFGVLVTDGSTSLQGQIVTREWEADGPGCRVPTGEGTSFSTGFTSLEGATITLTVTDTNGSSGSKTLGLETSGVPVLRRKLYAATETTFEAFDGDEWRSQVPEGGEAVHSVSGGAHWTAGNRIYSSGDDLITTAQHAEAWAVGEEALCSWTVPATGAVYIGGNHGSVAMSVDNGVTWETLLEPHHTDRDPLVWISINHITVNPLNTQQVHVLTNEGWFTSEDGGRNYGPDSERQPGSPRDGDFAYFEIGIQKAILLLTDGTLVVADPRSRVPFTFGAGAGSHMLVAATCHLREDVVYALADDGTAWVTAAGSLVLEEIGHTPTDGVPAVGGMYRDSTMADLIYFAMDTGLFKTLDGFKTDDGYLRLRDPARLTP